MFKLNHISVSLANSIANYVSNEGYPTENRVLILSPKDQDTKVGNLIVPGTTKEGMPREGVVIMTGEITEDYRTYKDLLKPGRICVYGLYAGKEIELELPEDIKVDNYEFTILSLNEVIFVRNNKNI